MNIIEIPYENWNILHYEVDYQGMVGESATSTVVCKITPDYFREPKIEPISFEELKDIYDASRSKEVRLKIWYLMKRIKYNEESNYHSAVQMVI